MMEALTPPAKKIPLPVVDSSLFNYDWGQSGLASKRRAFLLEGILAGSEGDHESSQIAFLEADRVFNEILDNNDVHPYVAARIKSAVIIHETYYLRQILAEPKSFDEVENLK